MAFVEDMSVLITRPQPAADKTALFLKKAGVTEVVVEPLLTINNLLLKLDKTTFNTAKGYIFSSVRVFEVLVDSGLLDASKPCLCVGKKTAQAARDFGFGIPLLVTENSEALIRHIGDDRRVKDPMMVGRWLHVAGVHTRGDISGHLQTMGIDCHHSAVYEALAAQSFSNGTLAALKSQKITHVLFYSERTITTFMSLIESLGASGYLKSMAAVCLSPVVADAAHKGPWQEIITAAKATEESLFQALGIKE